MLCEWPCRNEGSVPKAFTMPRHPHPIHSSLLMLPAHRRPCKKFQATYIELAERFKDAALLELTGDESPDMRKVCLAAASRSGEDPPLWC